MALKVKSVTHDVQQEAIKAKYKPFSVVVAPQDAVMQMAIKEMYQHLKTYAAVHVPQVFHHGLAETAILFPISGVIWERLLFLAPKDRLNYEPGSITRDLKKRGDEYASAVTTLSLTITRSGTNAALDVANSLLLSPNPELKADASQILKDFVYNVLTNRNERNKVITRLKKTYTITAPGAMNEVAVNQLAAFVQLGKGTVLPPEQVPYYQCLRSLVLIAIGELIDIAITTGKSEIYSDVLTLSALFATYVNITESEQNYTTAFPPIPSTLTGQIVQGRRIKAFQQMAMIFEMASFNGKAFNGDFTAMFLDEIFKVFPAIADIHLYEVADVKADGSVSISMEDISYLKEVNHRFEEAKRVFTNIGAPMFKHYAPDVLKRFKEHAEVDHALPDMFDDLLDINKNPVFKNLTPEFLGNPDGSGGVSHIVPNPDDVNSLPIYNRASVTLADLQTFMLQQIIPAVESLYNSANTLEAAYNNIFADLGTPSGGMVPGLQIELKVDNYKLPSASMTKLSDMTSYQYPSIKDQYLWPVVMPAFIIDKNERQYWSLSFLKHKIIRPDLIALKFARDSQIPDVPADFKLDFNGKGHPHHKWVWIKETLPVPSFMQNSAFSFIPVPFNYVQDFSEMKVGKAAHSVDDAMTRTGKYMKIGNFKFSEVITQFITAAAVVPEDVALSYAGLGFFYTQQPDKTWSLVSPECPMIYGMPYVLFKDINEIDVSDCFKTVNGMTFLKSKSDNPDVTRVMHDPSNKMLGIGTSVFVLHEYVPVMRKLNYVLGSLRNGFSTSMPVLAPIFSVLLNAGLTSMTNVFKSDKMQKEIIDALKGNTAVPMVNVAEALNKVVAVFFTQPNDNGGKSADDYYKKMLEPSFGMDYDEFKDAYFERVMGWSRYLISYPHLSMAHRFVDPDSKAFQAIIRGYTSRLYIDKNELNRNQLVNFLSIAPDNMQIIDGSDEVHFHNVVEPEMLEVDTVVSSDQSSIGGNQVSEDELSVVGGVTKQHQILEGHKLTGDKAPTNTPTGDIPESKVEETIKSLETEVENEVTVNETKNKIPEKEMIAGGTQLNLDTADKITTQKKEVVIEKEPTVNLTKGVDLGKDAGKVNKDNIGTGDVSPEEQAILDDPDLTPEEKEKKIAKLRAKSKSKKKEKPEDDSDE